MPVIKIIGGHGKIALLLARELSKDPRNKVFSLFRNSDHTKEVAATGAIPEVFDVEHASVQDFVEKLKNADFIVWSAGAGGKGSPQRTYEVDRDAAIKSMQAVQQASSITRYIMVSFLGASNADKIDQSHYLYHYGQAKKAADDYLKQKSGLKWTILNPGLLTDNAPTGLLHFGGNYVSKIDAEAVSRGNVALVAAAIVENADVQANTLHKEIGLLDGNTPVEEGLLNYK